MCHTSLTCHIYACELGLRQTPGHRAEDPEGHGSRGAACWWPVPMFLPQDKREKHPNALFALQLVCRSEWSYFTFCTLRRGNNVKSGIVLLFYSLWRHLVYVRRHCNHQEATLEWTFGPTCCSNRSVFMFVFQVKDELWLSSSHFITDSLFF